MVDSLRGFELFCFLTVLSSAVVLSLISLIPCSHAQQHCCRWCDTYVIMAWIASGHKPVWLRWNGLWSCWIPFVLVITVSPPKENILEYKCGSVLYCILCGEHCNGCWGPEWTKASWLPVLVEFIISSLLVTSSLLHSWDTTDRWPLFSSNL